MLSFDSYHCIGSNQGFQHQLKFDPDPAAPAFSTSTTILPATSPLSTSATTLPLHKTPSSSRLMLPALEMPSVLLPTPAKMELLPSLDIPPILQPTPAKMLPSPLYCSSPTLAIPVFNDSTPRRVYLSPIRRTPARKTLSSAFVDQTWRSCEEEETEQEDRRELDDVRIAGRRLFQSLLGDAAVSPEKAPASGDCSSAKIGLLTFILDTECSQHSTDSTFNDTSCSLVPSILSSQQPAPPPLPRRSCQQRSLASQHQDTLINATQASLQDRYPHLFQSIANRSSASRQSRLADSRLSRQSRLADSRISRQSRLADSRLSDLSQATSHQTSGLRSRYPNLFSPTTCEEGTPPARCYLQTSLDMDHGPLQDPYTPDQTKQKQLKSLISALVVSIKKKKTKQKRLSISCARLHSTNVTTRSRTLRSRV